MQNVIEVARNTCIAADIVADQHRLTDTEREMLHMLVTGHRVATMATTLFLAHGTIRNRLSLIYTKVGVQNQTQLMAMIHRTAAALTPDPA